MRMEKEGPKIITGSHRRAHFLIAIPTLGMVPIEFVIAFARLQMPVNAKANSMVVTKTEVAVARNHVAEYALSMKPRPHYVIFIGDDMIPPWDGVIKLWQEMLTEKWDVLSGLYFIKQDLPIPIIWRRDVPGYLEPFKHYTPGEIVWVDICGMDFTIIKTEVFEKIEKPWFETGPGKIDGKLTYYTEDVFFCDKVRKAKLNIGVHTDIRVGHLFHKTGEVY